MLIYNGWGSGGLMDGQTDVWINIWMVRQIKHISELLNAWIIVIAVF